MSVIKGFVIVLMLLFILYMFYRLYITREYIIIISLSFQICIFTMASLAFFEKVGTTSFIESLYLLLGIFLPGAFFAYDYCHVISRVKKTGIYGRYTGNDALNAALGNDIGFDYSGNNMDKKVGEYTLDEWSMQFNTGVALYGQGRYIEALDMFKKALDIKPDEFIINYHIGSALIELKRYNEALAYFKKALAAKLTDSEIFYDIATVYSLLKKYDIAVDALRNAIELNDELKIETRYNSAFESIRKRPEFRRLVS